MKLLDAVTSTSTPTNGWNVVEVRGQLPQMLGRTFQAYMTGSGAVSATVVVEVTNDRAANQWLTLGTISLSGTTTATDGFASYASWLYVRARLTAVSGTSAAVSCVMGV
jgi:hypothetical protein